MVVGSGTYTGDVLARLGLVNAFGDAPDRYPRLEEDGLLAAGADLPEAAALANLTAGLSVAKQGTATVSRDEVSAALHLREIVATDDKIVSAEQARARVAAGERDPRL